MLISCHDFKCLDTNEIFQNNPPESDLYKRELVKQLNHYSNSEIFYFTDKVINIDSFQLLYISIKSDSLCATGILQVRNSNQLLENLLKAKGVSYEGSQLKNLKYVIDSENNLIFKSVDAIVD